MQILYFSRVKICLPIFSPISRSFLDFSRCPILFEKIVIFSGRKIGSQKKSRFIETLPKNQRFFPLWPLVTPFWCIIMIISYVILFFDLDKVSLGKKCAPIDLVKVINVKLISTVDDVIISTVGCKSKLGFASLKTYTKTRPPPIVSHWEI